MKLNNSHKQHPTLIYEDLTVKIVKGKYAPYTYISPNNYTRQAHKFNQLIYIYITGSDGWVDTHCFKNANRLKIIEYLKIWKQTSRRYVRAKRAGGKLEGATQKLTG